MFNPMRAEKSFNYGAGRGIFAGWKSVIARAHCVCSVALCLAMFGAISSVRAAELPSARLTSLFPFGAKQGSTVEVTFTGQDLDDLSTLHFSDSRIVAKAGSGANKFQVTVSDQVPPGIYDVRAIGRFGVSNPRAFVVGTLAESTNKPGNTSIEKATPIAVGQTIDAIAEANARQYYKLALKKGQRIFAEIEARTIDSRMEPSILLADSAGNDRVICRRGELIDFTAQADGDYFLIVYDFTYQGGAEFFYRLTVRSGPQIDYIVPPAGMRGTKGGYTLVGRNLPGSSPVTGRREGGQTLEQLTVEIDLPGELDSRPAPFEYVPSTAAFMDGFDYRLNTPEGISNSIRIGYATAPIVEAQAATVGGAPSAAQKLRVPCEVAGQFLPRNEPHCFTFDVAANSVFNIEVFSSRLGNPTAPFLLIQRLGKDDKGVEKITDVQEIYESPLNLGGPEFRTSSRDGAYRLEAKEAGTYRLVLRDLFTTSADAAALSYRLSIRKETPDFRLIAYPPSPVQEKDSKDAPITTPLLRRGGITPIKVVALRQDNFNGEIELKVDGLPAGVTCAAMSILAGASSATLLLSAADDAPAGFGSVQISGVSNIGGAAVTRVARPGTVATSSYDAANKTAEVASRRARELFVAVVPEASPLSILPAKNGPFETCVFNKLSIPIKVVRHGEIAGPIALKLVGHSLLAAVKEVTIEPAADTATIELDLAQIKLTPGVYNLNVETLAKLKYRNGADAAKEAEAASKQAEKTSADLAAAAKTAAATFAALKPDAADRGPAEKASTEAAKKAKDARAALVAAQARAKELTAKAQPKDATASFYSPLIRLTVTASPITLAPLTTALLEAGAKVESPIELTRLYGFADAVDLAIVAPNVKGVSGKVTLAKDQSKTKLMIQSDAATPAGEYAVKLEAKVKVGGQTITVEQPLAVKVAARAPSK
jgi:hypothetical protein